MTEENGTEPPKWVLAPDEDEPVKLGMAKMLADGPTAWVDGARFILRRRSESKWSLVLESSPPEIVDSRPLGGRLGAAQE